MANNISNIRRASKSVPRRRLAIWRYFHEIRSGNKGESHQFMRSYHWKTINGIAYVLGKSYGFVLAFLTPELKIQLFANFASPSSGHLAERT